MPVRYHLNVEQFARRWSLGHRHKSWPRPWGMLAGRSGWINIADDAAAAETPDITPKRVHLIYESLLRYAH